MGILKRLGSRISQLNQSLAPSDSGSAEAIAFEASVPLGAASEPLWRLRVQMVTEPHADGDRLRLRAHIQTNLASSLRVALQAPDGAASPTALGDGRSRRGQRLALRAGQLVQRTAQRALTVPLVGLVVEPLLRLDLNTWIEVQASTASLDAGAHELLPQADRLAALGIQPRRVTDQPVAESWAGEAPDGFAQVSVLQMDKRHLPQRVREALGSTPFSLAAAVVNTAQQK